MSTAAAAPRQAVVVGNDVSWPQCGKTLPGGQAFAVVGVNGGLANNTNQCLAVELNWAAGSVGGTGQPLVSLYVNTANPGTAGSWWPQSNSYGGAVVANPYGTCVAGSTGAACSYMYGYAKAYDDANSRGVTGPGAYLWWLDVETGNSWSSDTAANRADLEGMAAYFTGIGARVGVYSTTYQWGRIAGTVASSSSLYGLPSWIPGARNLSGARSACSGTPLTSGGKVVMTQYVSGGLDYDFSCV
ncbi:MULTISPECIES: hypothetical protein [Arthrobacter]|uniref:DUF1906 domain-containing protein n=2 Tax=Arthrobacter TaxID=1663 RepID=A0ABU9KNV9_9MICC|nr:hypothetical protein [Arthrobacter sp. YJM1]MDP5228589.1 hypothetical protein [Arthrobacter sp. YJM1]